MTIVSSLKDKNTQSLYIFNGENPQNSEPQNGPRRGLDFIAKPACKEEMLLAPVVDMTGVTSELGAHEHEFHQKTYRESSSLSSNIKAFCPSVLDNSFNKSYLHIHDLLILFFKQRVPY